nr:hypothetical protein [Tanacetum cinerariifolium]
EEEASNTIKLEDLVKLVSHVQPSFKDLDSPKDDHVIVVDVSDEDEEDKVHATKNVKTKDTSVPKSSSPSSGNDALADSIAKADPGNSAPSDFVPQQQVKEEEASNTIKLEDLVKLVSHVQPSFKDLDSPKDDHVIVVDVSDEDEEDKVHATKNVKTKDTSVPKSSSP